MKITKAPWQNLGPKPLAFGEWGGVIIQYTEAAPLVLAVDVVPQAVPGAEVIQADRKGERELRCAHSEN